MLDVFVTIAITYLAVGFAKWVLDMSRIGFLHKLVVLIDQARAEHDERPPRPSYQLLVVIALGMSVQTLFFWPEILYKEGLLSFLQPISKQRAAEVFGGASGVEIQLEEGD